MSSILITGASGFLGTKLRNILSEEYFVTGTYSTNKIKGLYKLNITDGREVNKLFKKLRPDVVIHTAAMADPDICERKPKIAELINHIGTRNVVSGCKRTGAKLIHISTDYVFDGEKGNYKEDDKRNPINVYGRTKMRAEDEVMSLEDYIILRFDLLYGYNGPGQRNGFFGKILKLKNMLEVDNEQQRQPLLVDDVGHAVLKMLKQKKQKIKGVYHLANPEVMTKYDLGLALEKIVRKRSLLIPAAPRERIAKRPKNVTLDCSKARKIGISLHSLEEAIRIIKSQYQSSFIET